jgi:hypothetical protein
MKFSIGSTDPLGRSYDGRSFPYHPNRTLGQGASSVDSVASSGAAFHYGSSDTVGVHQYVRSETESIASSESSVSSSESGSTKSRRRRLPVVVGICRCDQKALDRIDIKFLDHYIRVELESNVNEESAKECLDSRFWSYKGRSPTKTIHGRRVTVSEIHLDHDVPNPPCSPSTNQYFINRLAEKLHRLKHDPELRRAPEENPSKRALKKPELLAIYNKFTIKSSHRIKMKRAKPNSRDFRNDRARDLDSYVATQRNLHPTAPEPLLYPPSHRVAVDYLDGQPGGNDRKTKRQLKLCLAMTQARL